MHDARQTFTAAALSTAAVAAEVDKTKPGQAGNFKNVDIFNAEKIQRRKNFVVEKVSSSYHTGVLVKTEYPARQSGSVGHARCHTPRQYSETGGSIDLALGLLPVAITSG